MVQSARRKIFQRTKASDQLRRCFRTTTGNSGVTVSRITYERVIVRNESRLDAEFCAHSFSISNHIASSINLYDEIVDHTLRQIFVGRPDTNLFNALDRK